MECLRHGTVELVSTVNNTVKGALHFLSCGCFGTAEQLRDPDYNPNPPAEPHPADVAKDARIAELEAQLAAFGGPPAVGVPGAPAEAPSPEEAPAAVVDAQPAADDAHVEPGASLFSDPAQVAPAAPAEAPAAEPPAIEGAA